MKKLRLSEPWISYSSVLVFLLFTMASVFPQKVTTKVTVYTDIFLTDTGYIPLPENAIELEPEFTIQSALFVCPLKLAVDGEGNVFVASTDNNVLCRFNARWEFEGQLGLKKDGSSELKGPAEISVVNDQLVVHEKHRARIDFMDLKGTRFRNRKISDIEGFAIAKDGRIYMASPVENKNSPLIDVLSSDGKKLGFGRPLSFLHSMPTLNSRSLALDDNGDIYVAFRYFPLVRKYSSEGVLISEFHIESPVMEAKDKFNLKAIGEGIADPTQRTAYKPLIIDIEASSDKVYLLSHIPRLEILELDSDGTLEATYWMDTRDIYLTNDLVVRVAEGEKNFYVAHSSPPDFVVDVLRTKIKAASSLEADIQKWTSEITIYPDNSLAYINRGAARHQAGDYRGALLDFSKAIELDPASALAFNNRGLSRLKTEDFEGATGDFSKAIELDPDVAAIYFNRGITFIHKNDYQKAIEDFTIAAKLDKTYFLRAQDQIDYCRTRLKNI